MEISVFSLLPVDNDEYALLSTMALGVVMVAEASNQASHVSVQVLQVMLCPITLIQPH